MSLRDLSKALSMPAKSESPSKTESLADELKLPSLRRKQNLSWKDLDNLARIVLPSIHLGSLLPYLLPQFLALPFAIFSHFFGLQTISLFYSPVAQVSGLQFEYAPSQATLLRYTYFGLYHVLVCWVAKKAKINGIKALFEEVHSQKEG